MQTTKFFWLWPKISPQSSLLNVCFPTLANALELVGKLWESQTEIWKSQTFLSIQDHSLIECLSANWKFGKNPRSVHSFDCIAMESVDTINAASFDLWREFWEPSSLIGSRLFLCSLLKLTLCRIFAKKPTKRFQLFKLFKAFKRNFWLFISCRHHLIEL